MFEKIELAGSYNLRLTTHTLSQIWIRNEKKKQGE